LLAACANRADLNQPGRADRRLPPRPQHRVAPRHDEGTAVARAPPRRNSRRRCATEIEQRLRRYDGDGLYHIGVRIEAFVLAQPGIPIVLSPQSVLLLAVNIWDNETRERLNDEPIRSPPSRRQHRRAVHPLGPREVAREQLENLSISAAQEIEKLLRENEETWFAPKPDRVRVEFTPGRPHGRTEATPGAIDPAWSDGQLPLDFPPSGG
jgi:hypothetical protein